VVCKYCVVSASLCWLVWGAMEMKKCVFALGMECAGITYQSDKSFAYLFFGGG